VDKDYLILKRASSSRSSGEWNDDDYDVLCDGAIVGRIFKVHAAPEGSPWMWTLAFGHYEDRTPTHGYAATREGRGEDRGMLTKAASSGPAQPVPPLGPCHLTPCSGGDRPSSLLRGFQKGAHRLSQRIISRRHVMSRHIRGHIWDPGGDWRGSLLCRF